MARIDTDALLAKLRKALPEAKRSFPTDPSVREAADAFSKLDEVLCGNDDDALPEDWCGTGEGDDDEDDVDDGDDDDEEGDGEAEGEELDEAESEAEMRRLLGGQ